MVQKINDNSVSTLKQACSGGYSGSLKLSSCKFKCAQNQSTSFIFNHTWFEAILCVSTHNKIMYFQQ